MKISKRTYSILTLPWRFIESVPLLKRVESPDNSFVTWCQIFWLTLLFPIAWPIAIICTLSWWAIGLIALPTCSNCSVRSGVYWQCNVGLNRLLGLHGLAHGYLVFRYLQRFI